MAILVYAEHDNAELKPATLNAVTAAQAMGGEIELLVAGDGCDAVAEAGSKVAGVAKVLVAKDAAYKDQLAENVAPLIAKLAVIHANTCGIKPRAAGCRLEWY